MPTFHFNIYDGQTYLDPTGIELADWQEARIEAIRLAGEVIGDQAQHLALGEDWHMEVANDQGLILFRLNFHILMSPATMSR